MHYGWLVASWSSPVRVRECWRGNPRACLLGDVDFDESICQQCLLASSSVCRMAYTVYPKRQIVNVLM